MKELTLDKLIEKAEEFNKKKNKWHFHVLMKKCAFNKNKGKFSVVLESEEKEDSFVSYLDERPVKDVEKLENMFYGRTKKS